MTRVRRGAPAALGLLLFGALAMSGQKAARAEATVECEAGVTGVLGAASIGVMGVAPDARQARLSLGWQAGATGWTTSLELHEGSIVPTPEGLFEVSRIVGEARGVRAKVVFARVAAGGHPAAAAQTMLLVDGDGSHSGGLRLGDAAHSFSMVVRDWVPDRAEAKEVDVDWWPGEDVREYADPASIHSARLAAGGRLALPNVMLTVVSIDGPTPQHPAWVVLRAE